MMKVFTDKYGINPDTETFRAPPSDGSEYIESRPFVELPDGTDISAKIVYNGVLRELTAEEITAIVQDEALAQFKSERPALVDAIKVIVDSMEFDGDETSQTRMARAITVMDDIESTTWVLADNTAATVTKSQLTQALKLSGQAQTALWVMS